jgi:hypothetical protein
MKNCVNCKTEIGDSAKFCKDCGYEQRFNLPPRPGVAIKTCGHCLGLCECTSGKTGNVVHSCPYCVEKAGVLKGKLFPRVPCQYCGGRGYHMEDLKMQKQQNQNQGQKKPWNKNPSRRQP